MSNLLINEVDPTHDHHRHVDLIEAHDIQNDGCVGSRVTSD